MKIIHPAGWARARGYSNGIVAQGRVLSIGGQIGWDAEQRFQALDFVGQFAQALANVVAIVRAAGAEPSAIVQLSCYVTDLDAYRQSASALGPIWREHMGRHYPAMALVGVVGLVEPQALVEIEGLAVLEDA